MNCIGRFEIDADLIRESPEVVRAVLAGCIPVMVDFLFDSNRIEYVAYNDKFDPIPLDHEVPRYVPHIDVLSDGQFRVRWFLKI